MTRQDMATQDTAVKAFLSSFGDEECAGVYAQVSGVWWFYCNYGDGCIDCYPVTAEDMKEAYYPTVNV